MKRFIELLFTCFFFLCATKFSYSQTKVKDTYNLLTKEKVKYSFSVQSLVEKPATPNDTAKIKFTFSLLGENDVEELNENTFTFTMKYTRQNTIGVMQHLPENIINKLGINSNKFPPNYQVFCREKILKNMTNTFRLMESDNKLKKIGTFE